MNTIYVATPDTPNNGTATGHRVPEWKGKGSLVYPYRPSLYPDSCIIPVQIRMRICIIWRISAEYPREYTINSPHIRNMHIYTASVAMPCCVHILSAGQIVQCMIGREELTHIRTLFAWIYGNSPAIVMPHRYRLQRTVQARRTYPCICTMGQQRYRCRCCCCKKALPTTNDRESVRC